MKPALALSLLAGWQPAEVIVDDRLNAPVLAAGADGSLHFVGARSFGPVEAPEFRLGLRTAPPGGPFGAVAEFEGVTAGVDASGTTTALLERDERLAVSTGGAAPVALSTRRTGAATLAVAPGGAAVAAWVERDGRTWRVAAAIREGETFGPAQVLSTAVSRATNLRVAAGSRGDAIVAWTDGSEYGQPGWAALRRPGGGFGAALPVTRRTAELRPAVGEDGTALLALSRLQPLDVRVFRARPGARRFARPQTIGCDDRLYASTVAPDGRAMVVCKHKRLETWEGRARLRRTARLPTGSVSGEDSVRIDLAAGGSALVTWSRAVPARFARARVMAALRSGRGAFAAPAAITDDFDSVQPVAARLVGDGAMVIAETFGAGRSMLAIRYR